MGSASEYMIESRPTAEISFQCPNCGSWVGLLVRPPDYEDGLEDDEQGVDLAQARCNRKTCQKTWTVEMTAAWPAPEFKLREAPETPIRASELYDGWDDEPYPEPGAHGIFLGGLEELRFMVGKLGEPDGASTVNRMLFVHLYSLMEAYLSDVLTGIAISDKEVQYKVLAHVTELRMKKLTLDDVLRQPTIVFDSIRANLAKTSFHNIEAVDKLSGAMLGHSLWPSDAGEKAFIEASILKRHDCVHRNGSSHAGNKHEDITTDYILRLAILFQIMAEELENKISEQQVERWFEDVADPEEKETDAAG